MDERKVQPPRGSPKKLPRIGAKMVFMTMEDFISPLSDDGPTVTAMMICNDYFHRKEEEGGFLPAFDFRLPGGYPALAGPARASPLRSGKQTTCGAADTSDPHCSGIRIRRDCRHRPIQEVPV